MNTVVIDFETIKWIFAFIVAAGGAFAVVVTVVKFILKPLTEPMNNIKKEMARQQECLEKDREDIDNLQESISEIKDSVTAIKEDQAMILNSIFVMLQHMATDNAKGEMEKELKKMMKYMAKK